MLKSLKSIFKRKPQELSPEKALAKDNIGNCMVKSGLTSGGLGITVAAGGISALTGAGHPEIAVPMIAAGLGGAMVGIAIGNTGGHLDLAARIEKYAKYEAENSIEVPKTFRQRQEDKKLSQIKDKSPTEVIMGSGYSDAHLRVVLEMGDKGSLRTTKDIEVFNALGAIKSKSGEKGLTDIIETAAIQNRPRNRNSYEMHR